MRVVSFVSSKGGAGKTTSAVILATTLAKHIGKVTVIDTDPDLRLMSWAEKGSLPKGIRVIESQGEDHIHDEIDRAKQDSNYVIVDTQGRSSRVNAFVMGESDMVIVPMADQRPDAEATIETLKQLQLEARAMRRDIPVRVLFARTKAAVKSRLEKNLNAQMRNHVGTFSIELVERTAFATLHDEGGDLYSMDQNDVTGVQKAIVNAEFFMDEFIKTMDAFMDVHTLRNGNTKEGAKANG